MGIKKYKPTSAGRRFQTVSDFADITKDTPEKKLTSGLTKKGGRNVNGRITVRHIGGGHKRRFRQIDFKRIKDGVTGKIAAIEYDPNRSARIALVHYLDGEKSYILAPNRLKVGDSVESGERADIKPGNALPLRNIPLGTVIHNIELRPKGGAKLVRSAGVGAQLVAKEGRYAQIRMPSSEVRMILLDCRASIGQVSNVEHEVVSIGKAGRTRWTGRRSSVRGTAMNPVDHPHGGGEGKSKGHLPCTPWGKPTIGYRTRKKKAASARLIVRRRNTK